MWLTDVSIRRPVFITMVVLALIILGLQGYSRMSKELNPKVDFPFITVVTVYPGAGPQEIETLVSQPIEEAVGSTANMKHITSTSQDGVSTVGMEFELGTDVNVAAADVRDKLSAARGNLPDDAEEPSIIKADISAQPVLTLALESNQSGRDMRILADNTIKDRLSRATGVAAVYVSGGQVREVSVAIDGDRLQAYGLSIDKVAQALKSENLNLPSGSIKEGSNGKQSRDYAVRTVGEFKNADEIKNIKIALSDDNAGSVRLGDIATVTDTVEEDTTKTRLNGRDSVILSIQKQSDANTVDVADAVKKEIDLLNGYTDKSGKKIQGQFPTGTKLIVTTDESVFVKEALSDVNKSLFEGIILVILIVFLFLHSGRATMIVATAIPTSLVATFLPMWIFGFTLNTMTLLALSLCVGILVDDSIVVLENIERHVRRGEAPMQAALTGRSEIGLAAVTITLVDVVVFVPIAFMGGIVGEFFRQFGITVAVATLFSLFMSFTLTPMLASRWLKSHEEEETDETLPVTGASGLMKRIFAAIERFYTALDARYRGVLAWALENRPLVITIGVLTLFDVLGLLAPLLGKPRIVLIALSVVVPLLATAWNKKGRGVALGFSALMVLLLLFVKFPLGGEFIPNVDEGTFSASIELPAGSGLDSTDAVVRKVENILKRVKGMEYYQSTIGSSSASAVFGGGDSGPQYASISVKLKDLGPERPQRVDEIVTDLNEQTALLPGGQIRLSAADAVGGGQPVQMEVTGSNFGELVRVSSELETAVKKVPGIVDVQNSWKLGKPELQVRVDRLRAADMGVSVSQIAGALRTSIEGNDTAKLRDQGEEYGIRVQLAKFDRQSTGDVANIIVGHKNGAPIYLRDVADITLAAAPNKINRKDRQRVITVGGNVAYGANLQAVQTSVDKVVKAVPMGTARINTGGTSQIMAESFGYMVSALILAIVLVYMLMGALFESFVTPLVIMFSLPQAMIGALLALMLTGNNMSIITMIGIIMLIGLVTKNAILLVDYTNTLRERGKSRTEAILEAGPTRLRPILMTTLAMVGGMLPTALALSKGSEQRAPLAITVIGGLILSTLLTLLVIPTFYSIIDDWMTGARNVLHKRLRKHPKKVVYTAEGEKVSGNGHTAETPIVEESDRVPE